MIYYESIGTKVVGKTITREKFAKIFDMRYKKSEHIRRCALYNLPL